MLCGNALWAATIRQDDVTLEVTLTPEKVELARDVQMHLTLTAPVGTEASFPASLADRLEGFALEGSYHGETVTEGGQERQSLFVRLRPIPGADLYRIAPFAVTYGEGRWLATKPMVLPLAEEDRTATGIDVTVKKMWVWPRPQTLLRYLGYAVAGALALCGAWFLFRWIRRRVRLVRMAPRERALLELKELLERHLPQHGKVKEFYVELTRIVRRYIERRYRVRAPEQTTEEFLHEATRHPSFTPDTLSRLTAFLTAADMVKFAGITVTEATIAGSTDAARQYIENEYENYCCH